MSGFVNEDAINELVAAVGDALRPLGITLAMDPQVAYDPSQKVTMLSIVGIVGESAVEKVGLTDEQKEAKKEMSKTLHEANETRVESLEKDAMDELARMLSGEDIFDDPLDAPCPVSPDGKHQMHPVSGFCIACQAGMEKT
ncbi:MAG: hypothetical protein DRP42_04090 [Tenericutes bacterium]|nr:MAG: hypothetical protein DRP42_04090 [Mycoplasmatota bacterium]